MTKRPKSATATTAADITALIERLQQRLDARPESMVRIIKGKEVPVVPDSVGVRRVDVQDVIAALRLLQTLKPIEPSEEE